MRISGIKPGLLQKTIILREAEDEEGNTAPLQFHITALPLGSMEKATALIPSPTPKVTGIVKHKGKVVQGPTGAPLRETNELTSEFKTKTREAGNLQMAYLIWQSLANDENVTWEFDPEGKTPKQIGQAVRKEFAEFGLAEGDYGVLLKAVLDLSNIGKDKLEEMEELFSSTEEE